MHTERYALDDQMRVITIRVLLDEYALHSLSVEHFYERFFELLYIKKSIDDYIPSIVLWSLSDH